MACRRVALGRMHSWAALPLPTLTPPLIFGPSGPCPMQVEGLPYRPSLPPGHVLAVSGSTGDGGDCGGSPAQPAGLACAGARAPHGWGSAARFCCCSPQCCPAVRLLQPQPSTLLGCPFATPGCWAALVCALASACIALQPWRFATSMLVHDLGEARRSARHVHQAAPLHSLARPPHCGQAHFCLHVLKPHSGYGSQQFGCTRLCACNINQRIPN